MLFFLLVIFIESGDESDTDYLPTSRRENVKNIQQPDSGFEEKKVNGFIAFQIIYFFKCYSDQFHNQTVDSTYIDDIEL